MYLDLKSKLEMYKSERRENSKYNKFTGPDIQDVLPGAVVSNQMGSFYLIENKYPLSYIHGGYPLGGAVDSDIRPVIEACGNLCTSHPDITEYAFLDTETTGLSGGTGTVAFLIGIGFFTDDAFVLRQYFMRDYNEEPALIEEVNRFLASYKGLVTFNGKAFDWNLLQTRFIFNRFRSLLKLPVHIDLLYPSRTLWKMKLDSCRLSSLEENILGEIRVGDIPGALIPSVYFKYLEDKNATEIKRVIKHNETDIISMVSLLIKINALLSHPLSETDDAIELLGIAKIFDKLQDRANAIHCYHQCSQSHNRAIREASIKNLAFLYKKNKEYDKAIELLEQLLGGSKNPNIPMMIELAKHYEHRIKDIPKALEVVQDAISVCCQANFLRNTYYADLKTRLERLNRKNISRNMHIEVL